MRDPLFVAIEKFAYYYPDFKLEMSRDHILISAGGMTYDAAEYGLLEGLYQAYFYIHSRTLAKELVASGRIKP